MRVVRHKGGGCILVLGVVLGEAFSNGRQMVPPRIEHETVIRQLDQQLEQIQQVGIMSLFGDATCRLPHTQGLHQDTIKVSVDIQGEFFSHSKTNFRKYFSVVSTGPSGAIRVVCEQSHAIRESRTFVDIPKKRVLRLLEKIDPPSEGFVGVIKIVGTLQIRMMVVLVDALKICAYVRPASHAHRADEPRGEQVPNIESHRSLQSPLRAQAYELQFARIHPRCSPRPFFF